MKTNLYEFLGLKEPRIKLTGKPESVRVGEVGNSTVEVGRFTYGVEGIRIRQWGEGQSLKIGQFCSIGAGVQVYLGGNHATTSASTYPFGHIYETHWPGVRRVQHPLSRGAVEIGNDVWIGEGATILSGVRIADGAVIGLGAVVAKDVAPFEVVVGNPGVAVRTRFDRETIRLLLELAWWDLDLDEIRLKSAALSSDLNASVLEELLASRRSS